MTTEIGLDEAVAAAQKLMAGQVRGRIVVKTA
jgi:acrylyl-CoA reductase (NADPH)